MVGSEPALLSTPITRKDLLAAVVSLVLAWAGIAAFVLDVIKDDFRISRETIGARIDRVEDRSDFTRQTVVALIDRLRVVDIEVVKMRCIQSPEWCKSAIGGTIEAVD